MARRRKDEGARSDFNKNTQAERERQDKMMPGEKLTGGGHSIPKEFYTGFEKDQASRKAVKRKPAATAPKQPSAPQVKKPAAPRVKVEPRPLEQESFKETITKDVSKKKEEPKGLSDNFKRAIMHLAPQAIGMLAGAAIGGEEGAVEGYDRGRQLNQDLHNLAQQDRQMDVAATNAETQRMFAENQRMASQRDKSKQRLSTNWVDPEGNPVLEKDGIPVDAEGNPIPTENLKRYQAPLTPVEEARIRNYEDIAQNRRFREAQANEADAQRSLRDMRATEEYKTSSKMLAQVPTIKSLIADAKNQGGQSLAMLGPKVAKGIAGEVGVLTEQDVTRYVQDPSVVGKVRDALLKAKSGQLSEVSADNLERLVGIMEQKANDMVEQAKEREAVLFSRRSGLPLDQARALIDENAQIQTPDIKSRLQNKLFGR